MKQLILLIALSTVLSRAYSQTADSTVAEKRRVSIYYEINGNTGVGSANYDRLFLIKKRFMLSYRVGFTSSIYKYPPFFIPAEINFLLGKGKHHLEIGTGVVFKTYSELRHDYFTHHDIYKRYLMLNGTFRLGYRYQQPEGGFFINACVVPDIVLLSNFEGTAGYDHTRSAFGIGVGYTIK